MVSKSATSFDEIGLRGLSFRSCRAYPKYGITAVIRRADARFSASIISNNSIRCSSTAATSAASQTHRAPHVLLNLHVRFAIGKADHLRLPALHPEKLAHLIGQRFVRRPAEYLELLIHPRARACVPASLPAQAERFFVFSAFSAGVTKVAIVSSQFSVLSLSALRARPVQTEN